MPQNRRRGFGPVRELATFGLWGDSLRAARRAAKHGERRRRAVKAPAGGRSGAAPHRPALVGLTMPETTAEPVSPLPAGIALSPTLTMRSSPPAPAKASKRWTPSTGECRDPPRRAPSHRAGSSPARRGRSATGGGADRSAHVRAHDEGVRAISIWLESADPVLMKRVAKRDDRLLLKARTARGDGAADGGDRYPICAEADITHRNRQRSAQQRRRSSSSISVARPLGESRAGRNRQRLFDVDAWYDVHVGAGLFSAMRRRVMYSAPNCADRPRSSSIRTSPRSICQR